MLRNAVLLGCLFWSLMSVRGFSQSVAEEKFQELFTTAGYSTALGAGLGAALLSFQKEPGEHLRYVAIGASVGFMAGSLLGSYLTLSPMIFGEEEHSQGSLLARVKVSLQPELWPESGVMRGGLRGAFVLML